MIKEIELFLFILSIIYTIRFLFEFVIRLFQQEPVPMKVQKVEEIAIYLSISYIITYLII